MKASAPTIHQARRRFVLLMLAPATMLLLGLTIVPFLVSVYLSFTNYTLSAPDSYKFIWLGNYTKLFASSDFWKAFRVTVIFTVAAVGIETLLGLVIAVLLHYETRAIAALRVLYLLPMAITPVAATFTFRLMFNPTLGVFNYFLEQVGLPTQAWLADPKLALPSLLLVDAWQWTPFIMLIIAGGLTSFPIEPFEAAKIDGANWWQTFRYLTLPMLRPFLAVAILFRAIDAFKTFDIIFVLTGGGPGTETRTLNLLAFKQGMEFLKIGPASSIAILMLITIIIATRLFLRYTGPVGQPQD